MGGAGGGMGMGGQGMNAGMGGAGFGTTGGFGSTTGGLGNAGGFGTGGGFGNGSSMSNFGTSAFGGGTSNTSAMGGGQAATSGLGGALALPQGFGNFSPMGAMGGMGMGGMGMGMGGMGMGGMGMGGMGGMGRGMGGMGGMGRNGMNQFGQNNSQNKNQSKIRSSVKVGFSLPQATVTARSAQIQTRMAKVATTLPGASGVQVVMDGRTAVLRGNVASQADDRMMQRLVSLEPGVSTVRSELNYPGKAEAAGPNSDTSSRSNATPEFVPAAQ